MDITTLLSALILLAFPDVAFNRPAGQEVVDLSYTFDNSTIGWPTEKPFQLDVTQNGTIEIGIWLQNEDILSSTHWGTHIDAPCHMAKGRWTLEEIPIMQLIAPAAVVDITERAATDPDAQLLVSDLEDWEQLWNRTLDDTIVLMRSGWGSRWPNWETYTGTSLGDVTRLRYPGVSPTAAQWLVQNRTIYGLGVDTLTLDAGVNVMNAAPVHQVLLGANVYGLENVANLHKLPGYGAQLHVSPMKLGGGACASPTRITAILP